MALTRPSSDFVSTTLNGALAAAADTATIGTGLGLPATNSYLQIDYDSTTAVGSDNGPETIFYAAYNSGTGALTGIVRGQAGTTDVAHANGAKVQCGMSTAFLEGFVGARACLASSITTTVSSGLTKLALDTETYDVGANFASNKFTAPVNGYYQISAQITYGNITAAGKQFAVEVYKNGAVILENDVYSHSAQSTIYCGLTDVVYLDATDYIELYYYHDDATTVDINSSAYGTYLTVTLLKEV